MRNFPTPFRFEDEGMQRELWAAVEPLGLGVTRDQDGTLRFKPEDWGAVNTEAHKLRDKKFGNWYFSNLSPEAFFHQFIARLRAHGLPYVLEYHGPRGVLLLPKHDKPRHREIIVE